MLETFQELYEAVQDDLNILDADPLFPLAKVKRAVNRAYAKTSALFRWSGTEHAKKTSTQANQDYYDYPQDFRDNSIFRIEIDGDQYGEAPDGSPMRFEDYLTWKSESINDNSTDKKWANQKRRFFITPTPTSAGSNNLHVWGQRVPDALSADGDTTIFSYSMPEGNEAIVLEASAILKSQGEEEKAGDFRSVEAKQILIVAWNKIRQEQGKYQKTEPFLEVSDMFGEGTSKQKTGNFD
jgi:hypothetical protein